MTASVIALFGEAEKGVMNTAYYCKSLRELFDYLGEPPSDTHGLFFAVQSILHGMPLIYFRVHEEGVSFDDYVVGMRQLRDCTTAFIRLQALFLPGVGSNNLIEEGLVLCRERKSLLIVTESDFYDYMTESLRHAKSA